LNDEPVEIGGHDELTAEAAILSPFGRDDGQQFLLGLAGRDQPGQEDGVDIDMAGRSGAAPAALRLDAGDVVLDGAEHDAGALGHVDPPLVPVG
jgi:hypothetical protein